MHHHSSSSPKNDARRREPVYFAIRSLPTAMYTLITVDNNLMSICVD